MKKILVFVMALSLSTMFSGCNNTDTSKDASSTVQESQKEEKRQNRHRTKQKKRMSNRWKLMKKKTAETMRLRIRF